MPSPKLPDYGLVRRYLPSSSHAWPITFIGLGTIADAPSGYSQYSDARYWVTLSRPDHEKNTGEQLALIADSFVRAENRVITVTNILEIEDSTHNLSTGIPVLVYRFFVSKGPIPVIHYVIVATPSADTAPISVVTDWRYDTASHKFQVKRRSFYLSPVSDETDWQDIHTAVDGYPVTDVNIGAAGLTVTNTTEYVLEVGSAASVSRPCPQVDPAGSGTEGYV